MSALDAPARPHTTLSRNRDYLLKGAHTRPPRNMRSPVFEEQRLDHYSTSLQHSAALPLQPPSSPARSQGLQLSTNDDALIGRADNGAAPRLLQATQTKACASPSWLCPSSLRSCPSQMKSCLAARASKFCNGFWALAGEHVPPRISAILELAGYPHLVRTKPSIKQLCTLEFACHLGLICWQVPRQCGRADAGMMWVWDLSATLGWAAGGGPSGSWLTRSTSSHWEVRMSCRKTKPHRGDLQGITTLESPSTLLAI